MKKSLRAVSNTDSALFQTLRMRAQFSIEIVSSPQFEDLSDMKKRLIDTIWLQEQKRRGGMLHEGTILSAVAYDEMKLSGHFVPYKYYLAQMCDPSLKPDLKIIPVSISGLTVSGESAVIAKRAEWVAQYPDAYELAPAGSIRPPSADSQAINLKEQILEEMGEEIGIARTHVKSIKFFALIRDLKEDGIELCVEIKLKPCIILSSTSEYTQVMTIPISELKSFTLTHMKEFVPLSLAMLRLKKIIT